MQVVNTKTLYLDALKGHNNYALCKKTLVATEDDDG